MTDNRKLGALAVAGYVATIVGANYAIHHLGHPGPIPAAPHTLPVWPGLAAPSGVYFVAVALVLRNVVQRQLGRVAAVVAILIGAAISWFIADPALAAASAVAFLCSEALDMAVYTPLRRYGQVRAGLVVPWPPCPPACVRLNQSRQRGELHELRDGVAQAGAQRRKPAGATDLRVGLMTTSLAVGFPTTGRAGTATNTR